MQRLGMRGVCLFVAGSRRSMGVDSTEVEELT